MHGTDEAGNRDRRRSGHDHMPYGHRVAATVGELLRQERQSLALAESCTGGLIAATMTAVEGSSDYLWGSAVVYGAAAKNRLIGLDEAFLEEHGTVSQETTAALAAGVRRISGATYGLAVTGWAGPGGGTEADPVGTVYLAIDSPAGVETQRCSFSGGRSEVRDQALVRALEWLQHMLAPRSSP